MKEAAMPETPEIDDGGPVLVLQGGTDRLQLHEGGRVYRPGDALPRSLSHEQRASLRAAGIQIATVHREPVITPEGAPAELAAAEQIEPAPGGPAVIAAVEDVPKDRLHDEQQRANRAGGAASTRAKGADKA
jgi:hypothetical protein